MRRVFLFGALALAVAGIAAGASWATMAKTSGGGLQVCAHRVTGELRVALGGTCRPNEALMTLSQGGMSNITIRSRTESFVNDTGSGTGTVTVQCAAGEKVTGGGGWGVNDVFQPVDPGYVDATWPTADGAGWSVAVPTPIGTTTVTAYAVCAS